MARTSLEDASYFIQRFLKSPREIASVLPSSRYLATSMFEDLKLRDGDVVIEFGPGTGSFTWEIERLVHAGIDIRYLGIEKDRGMFEYVRQRFRNLDFVLGDAANTVAYCEELGLEPAAAVISGLPLILMPLRDQCSIVNAARSALRPNGVFRTFSYVHSYPSRSAGILREKIQRSFASFDLSRPVVRNVPPAFLYTGRDPRSTSRYSSEVIV